MVCTAFVFGKFAINSLGGETEGESIAVDYLTNDIKVALFKSSLSAVLNQDTNEFVSDLVPASHECSGGNYSRKTFGSKQATYTAGTNVSKFSADTYTEWTDSTITARYAVVFRDTGSDATSPLIFIVNFNEDKSSSGGPFKITWDTAGLWTSTAGVEA